VVRCSFDGSELKYLEHAEPVSVPALYGLDEPALAELDGRYYVSWRNVEKGYVGSSPDGLNFRDATPWRFDDGAEIGSYNTQQRWLKLGGKLHLVYTRRGGNNDHIFRHRAPLFVAEFDPERRCLIRSTEQIAIPERGARLGNFDCVEVSENEAWVVAAEWMQNSAVTQEGAKGMEHCMKYGSDNSIFIARITT